MNPEMTAVYTELYTVIEGMGEEYISKLPEDIWKFLRDSRKERYVPIIDEKKPIEGQIRRRAFVLLGYFNLKYWVEDEKERKKIMEHYKENGRKKREEREKFNIEKFNEIAQANLTDEEVKNVELVTTDEIPWYKKIFAWFRNLSKK